MSDKRLHPDIRIVLDAIEAEGGPALETLPVEEARRSAAEALKPFEGQPEPVARVQNIRVPGAMPVRVYSPGRAAPRPALVYFHGGGWVLCDLDTHDVVCRAISRRAEAVVVAVDYRLSPENNFPVAVEDCYAATRWVASNTGRLGIDPRRIAVGGDSAGGNLAAVVALKARDEQGPALALQVLVYPVTNLSSFDTPSYAEFAEGYFLTKSQMEWFRDSYLAVSVDAKQPYASPLLATDLHGLPPALVITAECDVLRDEGEAYAKRLENAGVLVTCSRYPGMIHPFFSMPGAIAQANQAIDQVAAALAACRLRA